MDLTAFITSNRDKTLGDWSSYRAQLSRQVHSLRKRLGRSTPKGSKYTSKAAITAEDIGSDSENVRLGVLSAERAWAHAMFIKAQNQNANKPISGSGRNHILTRLRKSAKIAQTLVEELRKQNVSKATDKDVLEAAGYAYTLAGAEEFEKQANGLRHDGDAKKRWSICIEDYSAAFIVYAALHKSTGQEIYREVLASTIEPSLRYASHSANLSRSLPLASVAKEYFRKDDKELQKLLQHVDAEVPSEQPSDVGQTSVGSAPTTMQWGSRKAKIADAAIGQALASVSGAEEHLKEYLASHPNASSRENATAFDEVIIASQDAADATRRVIDDLEREHVDEGDGRMQDLRVISLAVNYDVVAWRVGRNRMLISQNDGAEFLEEHLRSRKRKRGTGKNSKEEPAGRRLARLRERMHLYEEILQSVDSIKQLRGAMRDAQFIQELDTKRAYFQALKCLNIAYSHTLLSAPKNSLALLLRAESILTNLATPFEKLSQPPADAPLKLDVSKELFITLENKVRLLVNQYRGLVELANLKDSSTIAAQKNLASAAPLVERLHEYPAGGVDLKNLVTYPPKLKPVPVKPIFLDVAWNYIEYPGQQHSNSGAQVVNGAKDASAEDNKPAKKGWFGFGR